MDSLVSDFYSKFIKNPNGKINEHGQIICICGLYGSKSCINNKCRKCCKNNSCKFHYKSKNIINNDVNVEIPEIKDIGCSICKRKDTDDIIYECGKCHIIFCDECKDYREKMRYCTNRNCHYCQTGSCWNNAFGKNMYCYECYEQMRSGIISDVSSDEGEFESE